MDRLQAGVALFNAGHYLAAHEPWEEQWLQSPAGERDDCLQGLIQATAAIHKGRTGNWSGAVGLAQSSVEYLAGCDPALVDAAELVAWLDRLATDPELVERERPPLLRVTGDPTQIEELQFPAAAFAASALAETRDDELVVRAVEYAEAALEAGDETGPFVALTLSYLRADSPTEVVRRRIEDHVRRRRSRESDVEGLFE